MYVLVLLIAILSSLPFSATAHVTKADGPMKVMVHMDPDDEPIAGQATALHLLFKHSDGLFELENCTCTAQIVPYKDLADVAENADKVVLEPSMRESSGSRVYSFTHTFPTKGMYAIIVEGTPKDSTFEPFRIVFDKRVERSSSMLTSPSTFSVGHVMMTAGFALLTFLVWVTVRRRLQRKPLP